MDTQNLLNQKFHLKLTLPGTPQTKISEILEKISNSDHPIFFLSTHATPMLAMAK